MNHFSITVTVTVNLNHTAGGSSK